MTPDRTRPSRAAIATVAILIAIALVIWLLVPGRPAGFVGECNPGLSVLAPLPADSPSGCAPMLGQLPPMLLAIALGVLYVLKVARTVGSSTGKHRGTTDLAGPR